VYAHAYTCTFVCSPSAQGDLLLKMV